ncbi:HAMP domain-containing histidine kinase [Paenibacillus sp. J5C_2022]|uniref:HAMP domain-containing sensor histidine kinase n=1 Tax=Paenibacillus sp. J5C2022 TaxID=2977129 RepID=UPI0021D24106|nr:HAMP domain-containing histidine kinase [Paenibacillus sp. J5C2022]MCU6710888.1 HAMP domain-containing histidine kinase [Paenibacillus sp. J5C2022]
MRRLSSIVKRMPFHWRMTLLSSLLLSALFAASNVVQFTFVESWMLKHEERAARQDMRELLNVLLSKEVRIQPDNEEQIRFYLEKANVNNGMVRILKADGTPIVTAANNMPIQWVERRGSAEAAGIGRAEGVLAMSSPLTIFHFTGTVEVVRSLSHVERLIAAFNRIMLICFAAAIVISAFGGRLMSRLLVRPLRSMHRTMRRVKQNGLQERMAVGEARDDITALTVMFNDMMDEVEGAFRKQKQFVEDASHELRTPVAIIEGHLAMLQRWGKHDPEVLEESLRISMEELLRLRGLVEELLTLSRIEKLAQEHLHAPAEEVCLQPDAVIQSAAEKIGGLHPSIDLSVNVSQLEGMQLGISDGHLLQLMLILLDNAVKYSGSSTEVRIDAIQDDTTGHAIITVLDAGIGMTEEELAHAWDRFYRADKARSGAGGYGLGLPIARQIVQRYNGTIVLNSKPGEGTMAALTLPVRDA